MMVWGANPWREDPMASRLIPHKLAVSAGDSRLPATNEDSSANALNPKLLGRVHQTIWAQCDSRRSKQVCLMCIGRFIFFHGVNHRVKMQAVRQLGIAKLANPHTLRQSFATNLFGGGVRYSCFPETLAIQALLGLKGLNTMMAYTYAYESGWSWRAPFSQPPLTGNWRA